MSIAPVSFSPFEMVVADYGSAGYSFMTMRDAIQPHRFKFATLNDTSLELTHPSLGFPDGTTGPPHAIGLWQQPGINESRLFITYADDPRPTGELFPNPNKLTIYSFPAVNPKDVLQRKANIVVGDYAEVGLIFDPTSNQMLGTFAGFPYSSTNGDVPACSSPQRGGTYGIDFDGNVSSGFAPNIVVGNPPLVSAGLDWRNPFEIAVNASNGKVYVTDRCWSDFPGGGQAGGGAVLIYARDPNNVAASLTKSALELKLPVFSSGDATGDGQIDFLDLTFIASRYGSNDPAADINGDGIVDLVDILIAERNYGPR